jgi:hypothetical protein
MHFSTPSLPIKDETITPNGNGPFFSYTPSARPEDLSPRSSSSSESSIKSSASSSLPRSRSSSPAPHITSSPVPRSRIVAECNFILEEFISSDYEDEDVIWPHQYEDADSEKAQSVRSSGGKSKSELDPRIVAGLENLDCSDPEAEREEWLKLKRAQKARHRRSSGATKRTLTQSIGSDTDDEDLQPVTFEANEAGSSARRLRRKVGDRSSLVFDDPPPRIDEEDENPEIEEPDDEDDGDGQCVDEELPYYRYRYIQEMDVDSDDESV